MPSACECTKKVLSGGDCSDCSSWTLTRDDVLNQHAKLLHSVGLNVDEFRALTDVACHKKCAKPDGVNRSTWHLLVFLDDEVRNA
jgi:hypothetical protein